MSQSDELLLLLAMYQKKYGVLASKTAERIKKYLADGYTPEKAISLALGDEKFFPELKNYIADAAVSASLLGKMVTNDASSTTVTRRNTKASDSKTKQITPRADKNTVPEPESNNFKVDVGIKQASNKVINTDIVASTTKTRTILLTEAWTPDKMNLSTRLHGNEAEIRQTIVDTVSKSIKQGEAWVKTSRDLYDGYNAGHITKKAELPEYLTDLVKQSKRILADDKAALREYNKAVVKAEYQISRLSQDGSPTRAMKQSFKNLLDAAKDLNDKAIDKAVSVAVEEKSRYIADRIARTEISRAWGDGFFAEHLEDPDVIAFRWDLSSRHPVYDICDMHAKVDCYGLGKGVYPKNKFPVRPAHPHCMCLVTPVYVGNLDIDGVREAMLLQNATFNPNAIAKYIDGAIRKQQLSLLGADGLKQFERDGSWQNSLRLWAEHEMPSTRLKTNKAEGLRIPEGDYNLKIRQQVQNRHIAGTKEYEHYARQLNEIGLKPSHVSYPNPQELIDKYHRMGTVEKGPSGSGVREIVITDSIIGQYWNNKRGMYIDTKAFKIVYSKKGAHIFPVWDGTKG